MVNAGKVSRYELPKIGALNFLVHGGLAGGASKSLMVDGHGKSFSSILLDLEIDAPPVVPIEETRWPIQTRSAMN